jgi:hypothetical protein
MWNTSSNVANANNTSQLPNFTSPTAIRRDTNTFVNNVVIVYVCGSVRLSNRPHWHTGDL